MELIQVFKIAVTVGCGLCAGVIIVLLVGTTARWVVDRIRYCFKRTKRASFRRKRL